MTPEDQGPRFRVVKGAGVLFDRPEIEALDDQAEAFLKKHRQLEIEVGVLKALAMARLEAAAQRTSGARILFAAMLGAALFAAGLFVGLWLGG